MKEKTNLFPSLIRLRETSRLKMAIAASIMLWCATPQQATADTNEEHAIEAVQQAKVKVKGTVVDETGEPMIGVAVKVLANNTGTITDLEGKFSVEAPLGGAIQISFIGYKTVTVKASSEPISVTLKEDSQQLDEVVVVGYGSQKKVNVTGSVSMVDSKVIESRPVQNVSQALQGVVPGLNMSVGNSGGALDSSLSINIRGAGTIGEGSSGSPLVLIDGIEGDMNTVNPNDIENISVLKDAASSSIYGARASFGVIMITTKSGKSGKTRVNYSGNVRFSDAIQIPDMVDSYTFAQYFNRANTNDGGGLVFDEAALERIKNYQTGKYTDPNTPEYYGAKAGNDGKWQNYTGSFDYYNRYTYDMIGPAPTLPSVLGASAPQINNCDMKSYGWELELSWRDRIQQFNYGVRLVMSDNMQKILEYPNKTLSLGEKYYTGKTIGEIWGYKTIGIAQTQEEMDKHLANGGKPNWGSAWGAGDIMYANIDGKDGVNSGANTVNDHGDLKIIGNSTPRYNFGLTLDGSWKGLDFSLFIQGVMKRDYMLDGPYFWGANGGMWQSCVFKEHLDYWRPEGDPLGANTNAYYPKPYFSSNKNQKTQSGYLQNAAYCRLKNAQIGYTLPKAWTKKAAMESVRVYVSGDNLLTISGISDIFDPETLGGDWGPGKLYPLQRTISIGLNVNF